MNPAQALCGPGKVSMIRQVQSLNPDNLAAWRPDVGIMCGESRITRRQREMIVTL